MTNFYKNSPDTKTSDKRTCPLLVGFISYQFQVNFYMRHWNTYRSNVLLIWACPCWQRIYVCENNPPPLPPIFQKKSIKVLETVCPQNIDLNEICLWEKNFNGTKKSE